MSKILRKSLDDLKEEVRGIVDKIKLFTKKTQEDIAVEMGYKKNYISEVLAPSGKVSKKFLNNLKLRFSEVIEGQSPPRETLEKREKNQGLGKHIPTEGTSFAVPKIMEQLLKEREATMQQLEARRNETEARLVRAEAEKDRLYKILQDNMTAMMVSLNQNQSHLLDTRQLLSDVIAPQVTAHRKALETLLGDEKKSEKIVAAKSGKGLGGRKRVGDGRGSTH